MSFVGFGSAEIFSGDDERADALKLFMKCQTGRDFDISRALLKTSESEPARRLSGHKTGKKPRNTIVFLCFQPFFCLGNPQAFSNSRFLEVP